MRQNLTKFAAILAPIITIIFLSIAVSSCDSRPSRSSYFEVEPGGSFSQSQLQCAVNVFVDQREANQRIENHKRCESSLPRLTKLQEQLREEWQEEQRSKWEARCAKEMPSLRDTCLAKLEEVLNDPPDHLQVPPEYREIPISRPIEVTPGIWRNVKAETDLKMTAARIVMDRVESDSQVSSAFAQAISDTPRPRIERTQAEKDLSDLQTIGYCARWIGRQPPDASLITEEYLDQEIANCLAR